MVELSQREFEALTRAATELEDYRRMVDRMKGYTQETKLQIGKTMDTHNIARLAGRLDAVEYMNKALLDVIRERMIDGAS